MDKNIKISMLLELYGKLLTEKQFDITDLYYNQNLSLSEIADELDVTRQAIRKSLIEAEKNLCEFESKLGLLAKTFQRQEKVEKIVSKLKDKELIKLIEELR